MGAKTVLAFETLPKNLPFTKKVILGVYDVSGIQRYIFGKINADTCSDDIRKRSLYISRLTERIFEELQFRYKNAVLFDMVSSGKIYCAISPKTDISELEEFSYELQKRIYASTGGRLSVFFAFTETQVIKAERFNNEMIPATAVLAERLAFEKLRPDRLFKLDMTGYFDTNLTEDALVSQSEAIKQCDSDCVAVNLDLDNLGAFFKSILAFDIKKNVSLTLDATLSQILADDKRISVILSGGDDIFFICDYGCHYDVISSLYKRLLSAIGSLEELKEYAKEGMFGISAGATRIRGELGTVPLLYYSEAAEKMLETSKNQMGKNCLCLDGRRLSWAQLSAMSSVINRHYDQLFPDKTTYKSIIKDPALLCDRVLKVNKIAHILKEGSEELNVFESYKI